MGIRANNPNADYLLELVRASLLHTQLPSIPEGCTPTALANMIKGQHLTNLVYPVILNTPKLHCLRELLEKQYIVQIPKIANQDVMIAQWLEDAEAAGVDCIPLKGYFMRKLYPNPMMRSMMDLDVLVRNMDTSIIRPWMESLGYVAEDEDEHKSPIHENYKKEPWMYMELHRHLMRSCPGRDAFEANIWKRATPVTGKRHIYQMSLEDYYVFHIHHLYRHFVMRGAGLKSVIDIYIFQEAYGKQLDQAYLAETLKSLDIYDFAAYMEKLAYIILGDNSADEDSKLVMDFMAQSGVLGTSENFHAIHLAKSGKKTGRIGRAMYRFKRLFPDVHRVQRHFPSVKKFPFLLPFYWVAMLFKVPWSRQHFNSGKVSAQKLDDVSRVLTLTGIHKT